MHVSASHTIFFICNLQNFYQTWDDPPTNWSGIVNRMYDAVALAVNESSFSVGMTISTLIMETLCCFFLSHWADVSHHCKWETVIKELDYRHRNCMDCWGINSNTVSDHFTTVQYTNIYRLQLHNIMIVVSLAVCGDKILLDYSLIHFIKPCRPRGTQHYISVWYVYFTCCTQG